MGAAMLAGGLTGGRKVQRFDRTAANVQSLMLFLAVAALVMPAVFELVEGQGLPGVEQERVSYDSTVEDLSMAVAVVLIATYVAGLFFSLRTHRALFNPDYEEHDDTWGWSVRTSVIALAIAGVAVGLMSEILVGSIEAASESVGLERVLHRRDRRRDRRQRGRALGRGPGRDQGQDGPLGQHRDRLQRPDRAVRRPGPGPDLVRPRPRPDAARLQRLRDRRARDRACWSPTR